MAKNKKKKKVQAPHQRKMVPGKHPKHSKTYYDTCYAVARRIFRALGEDESTFDIFTKRQKQDLFALLIAPPRIATMEGHKVPRQYTRYIQDELVAFMKRVYFNVKAGVTWMDMATVGMSMYLVFGVDTFLDALPAPQRAVVDRMCKIFTPREFFDAVHDMIEDQIKITLMYLSQPNFRIYGQVSVELQPALNAAGCQQVIRITSHECQSLRFKYHNKERTAFRIATGQCAVEPYTAATIAISKIFPGKKHDRLLNIYIQSHAIHRFKERIDTLFPMMRNQIFVISFMLIQRIVQGPNGILYIACAVPVENGEVTIGYFAFTIDGDNLFVLTLLPLLSSSVPEGRVLYDRLHLSTEDLKYLGMDKLSFFYDVDIEQIPILKQVLYDELHLDYVRKEVYHCFQPKNSPFNEKKTLLVKNFFQKLEEQSFYSNNEQYTGSEEANALIDEEL